MSSQSIISIDAMGGDHAPGEIINGLIDFAREQNSISFILHGRENEIKPFLQGAGACLTRIEIHHTETYVAMDDKPSQAIRRSKGSSMWNAVELVKKGEAAAALSAGNTGALMALSRMILKMVEGINRPALGGMWPHSNGTALVLDLGADIEADANQLVEFALMGDAFARSVLKLDSPKIGLLNIGTEDLKGKDTIKLAAALLNEHELRLNYCGFAEASDISMGTHDVIVSDGFTGNIALKAAEGAAKLVAQYVSNALKSGPFAMAGALLASNALTQLKNDIDPRKQNGGMFLGLKGLVVKSHGGADRVAFANALNVTSQMASSEFHETLQENIARWTELKSKGQAAKEIKNVA